MINTTMLVGRLANDTTLETDKNDNKFAIITVSVPRSVKNEEGIYENDIIPCYISGNIATNTCEYCRKGDIVGIKGKLEMKDNKLMVIAEKITFLSSNTQD